VDADSQRWWCPACVRMHGLTEVELYEQDGVKGYTCRESGAVVQPVQTPAGSESGANGTADEQRYWCPACMRSHTASEVAPFTHGSDHGLACRLTGAVVEPLATDVQVAAPSPEHPSLVPADLPQAGRWLCHLSGRWNVGIVGSGPPAGLR
jgi:hypothetical protein